MKVFHIIPTLAGGGAERQLAMLAVEQVRRGLVVHVAVRQGGIHEECMRQQGVTIHRLGNHRGPHPLLFWRMWCALRAVEPDVVQTWLLQMDIVGGLVALIRGKPWIATERSSAGAYVSKRMRASIWVRTVLFRRATAVVANSGNGVDYWRERLGEVKVVKISNAIDAQAIRMAASMTSLNAEPRHALPDIQKIFVVGRLISSKALDVVIDAIKRLPRSLPVQVRIMGDGPLHSRIEALICSQGLEHTIQLLPYCECWWRKLGDAALLISMSRYEGQPNVVLEAMAAGCPLIVSDIPAHREILDEQSALFVPVDEADALARACMRALADPHAAKLRAQHASTYVEQLTISRAAEAYEDVYTKAIKGGR